MALDDVDHLWFFKTNLRERGKGRETSLAAALVRSLVGPHTRLDQDYTLHLGLVGWCSSH